MNSVATRYNEFQKQQTGKNPKIDSTGIVYCVDFDSSFTNYLPEDLVDDNFCASRYGVEFTLVNDFVVDGSRTWDPWFDVPGTDRKKPELMHYLNSRDEIVNEPTEDDYAVYALIPPTYCEYPSPGKYDWNQNTKSWTIDSNYQALGRKDSIPENERCTDPPEDADEVDRMLSTRHDNRTQAIVDTQERTHARDLSGRQSSPGGFLDPNIYNWFGCGIDEDEGDDADGDACADDSNPCGDDYVELPDNSDPSLDPLPVSGVTTRPFTPQPTRHTTTAPSYVSCSTHNADPDGGIARGYCVCSGSTFALSIDSHATPVNSCAYTSPLPKTTTSISTLPTGPTSTKDPATSPSPYILVIYTRQIEVAVHGGVTISWWWDCRPFDRGHESDTDVCNLKENPIAYSSAIGRVSPSQYPTTLATFSLHGHPSCSYRGPNTATVGSVVCDDGLTAKCTAAPKPSQTDYIDCTDGESGENVNGLVKDL